MGFAGALETMGPRQLQRLEAAIRYFQPREFHHGGARGSDEQMHAMVRRLLPACFIVARPTTDYWLLATDYGASGAPDKTLKPKSLTDRTRDLIHACRLIVAAPATMKTKADSNPWVAVRYASFARREIYVIFPNGTAKRMG